MAIVDVQIRTVTCNGVGCDKTVTYDAKDIQPTIEANPWLKTLRIVQTASGRNFAYHSDECELSAVAAGSHNPEEPKKIIAMPAGANAIAAAAAAAKAAEEGTKALKSGADIGLHQS